MQESRKRIGSRSENVEIANFGPEVAADVGSTATDAVFAALPRDTDYILRETTITCCSRSVLRKRSLVNPSKQEKVEFNVPWSGEHR